MEEPRPQPPLSERHHQRRIPATTAEVQELLDDPRAPELVRELPTVQLHRMICAVGRTDATEILALAAPEQLREILDLEIWQGDQLQPAEALDWLHFLSSLPDGPRQRDLRALDPELLGLVVLRQARIHLLVDEELPPELEDPDRDVFPTPDGWFAIENLAESDVEAWQLKALVEALYRDDANGARRLLHQLIAEFPLELEEMAFRWRNGRLQDLGFTDPEEALLIYAYLDPVAVRIGEGTADLPLRADPDPAPTAALQISVPGAPSFWREALAGIDDPALGERLAWALATLSNRCLVADRVPLVEIVEIERSLVALHRRLSLGLEHLCGGDLRRSGEVLRSVALLRIARVGHSLALDSRRRLLPLLRGGKLGRRPGSVDLLDQHLEARIAALLLPRPLLEDPETGERRPPGSLAELGMAGAWVEEALATDEVARALSLPDPLPPRVTIADLYRTTVVNHLLGREGPLARGDLARLLREVVHAGLLPPRPPDPPAALSETAGRLLARWYADLRDSVGELDPKAADPRFVAGLWFDREE